MVEGCASWEDFHNQQACLGCCRPEPIHTSVCKGRRARRDSFGVSLLLCGSQLFFFGLNAGRRPPVVFIKDVL
jgi:hypothetical protein